MEEVGAQVAPSMYMHPTLSSRFCELPMMAKKRHLSYQPQNYGQQRLDSWNPKHWDWDSAGFVAKPVDSEVLRLGTATSDSEPNKSDNNNNNNKQKLNPSAGSEEHGRLDLNLGGGLSSLEEPVVITKPPNKRVRSGYPGTAAYPMCQVDNCKEDLSNAKDYHRRHKVCEPHSKSTKALVGKQMQRFCQQCSRFHPLSEFDEGKRSCRRRLAGHNRRRRKTQAQDVTSSMLIHGNQSNTPSTNVDIISLLAALARAQGTTDDRSSSCSSVPDKEQLLMILSKINSLPLPADLAARLHNFGSLKRNNPVQSSSDFQNRLNRNASSTSTMDLLAVLSSTLTASPDLPAAHSQRSSHSSDSEKTKSSSHEKATPNIRTRMAMDFPSVGGERSSPSFQSPVEDSDGQIQETPINFPLQLFSSSPENDSPPKLSSSRKYFSSDSSNPTEDRSPSSSPAIQTFFPMQRTSETIKSEKHSIGRDVNANVEGGQTRGPIVPLELFSGSNKAADNYSFQSFPYQAGYTSSSGSDHSPSSLNSDAQDRTGRIIFKLFDKDPSHFPGTLRKQIYNWLSNSPSDMESYIRPGCVVLSLYVSMPSASWERLQGNLFQQVSTLVQDSNSEFWRNSRFLVHVGKQLASHKSGNIRVCKSWRTWSSPELISVSPLAVVGGQEISLKLTGRNLTNHGTKIHCTFMGGYASQEVIGSACQGSVYDEINLGGLKLQDTSPSVLGRFFIEVENGFKGNSFPVIIADATICKELRLLESEFGAEAKACGVISEDQNHEYGRPRSTEEVLCFLNELGWLFQRTRFSSVVKSSDYSLSRFKFLLIFSVDRGCCALVKAVLDILVEGNLGMGGLSRDSVEMLCEAQLLNRAVKMRCKRVADMLINYSIPSNNTTSRKYIFSPSVMGPGGVTPLHLAACASDSEDIVDALTNDPQEIGLSCWDSVLDANGHSPYSYACLTNNHSYNKLVARKLADKRNGQVSIPVGMEMEQSGLTKEQVIGVSSQFKLGGKSCAKCAVATARFNKRVRGSQGLLNRPYIHSMLAIAAVCVCVCLFLRGSPDLGLVAPFKWENLDYGPK